MRFLHAVTGSPAASRTDGAATARESLLLTVMPLTNDMLSVWELGHRLAGEDPDAWRPFGLPLKVRDALRMLVNEIFQAHLESTLIMEKWREGQDTTPDMHIRYHLPAIEGCIDFGKCYGKFLRSVGVDRWVFQDWCQQSGYPLPDFWFSVEYTWPGDSEDSKDAEAVGVTDGGAEGTDGAGANADRLKPSSRARTACQEIAKALWRERPSMTIADMVKREEIMKLGGAASYSEKTRRGWVNQVAPPEVRERRGRPRQGDKDVSEQ